MSVRLKDVAEKAGVSIATASKVLNNKTSDIGEATINHVKVIAQEIGYVPNAIARAMKTNRSNIIGLIIPDIRNPFFTEIARGAEDLAYELGYSLFLCNTDDDLEKETKYIQSLQQLRIDGIVIAGSFERDRDKEISLSVNTPLIAIDREIYYKDISSFIKTDSYESSKEMSELLYSSGYRNYYYLGGPLNNSVANERYEGTMAGITNKNDVKFESDFVRFLIEDGYSSVINNDDILEHDVIICGNDLIAIGVLNALKERGIRVPEDISIVGFDDIHLASAFSPRLTTIRQPAYEMGADAIIIIDEIIKGKKPQSTHTLKQSIVIRDTTSKITSIENSAHLD